MKLFLVLLSLPILTVQSAPGGCQFCVQGIMKVFNYAATDSGIQESILLLQDLICPFEEEVAKLVSPPGGVQFPNIFTWKRMQNMFAQPLIKPAIFPWPKLGIVKLVSMMSGLLPM